MPVVGIAGAIAGAEALAGTLTVLETIAAVGAVVGGVGVVTGNSDLAKIGAVMGLVGGVGAMADNAGMFGGTSDIVKGLQNSADLAEAGAGEGARAMESMVEAGEVAQASLPQVPLLGAPPVDVNTVQNISGAAQTGAQLADEVAGATNAAKPAGVTGEASTAPGAIAKATMGDTDSLINWAQSGGAGAVKPPSAYDIAMGKAGSMLKWAKDNQTLAAGILQVGGKFAEGLFDPTIGAKQDYLASQSALNRAQTGLINQRTASMSGPAPTAVTGSVARGSPYKTGPAPVYVAPMPGVDNSVTGTV